MTLVVTFDLDLYVLFMQLVCELMAYVSLSHIKVKVKGNN